MATLVIAALAVSAGSAAGHGGRRYAAVDDLSPAGGGALVPRFFVDEPKLAARDGSPCPANSHSCLDIRFPGHCCANDHYCYVKPDGNPWCCQIGSTCGSVCTFPRYLCMTTLVVTMTPSPTSGGSPASTVVTSTTTSSGCCGRRCTSTSNFLCPTDLGGDCCEYGNTCASDNKCVKTVSQSTSMTGGLTPVDPGCTATTQHACEDGGGCCDNLMHCTVSSGTAACAPGNPTAGVDYNPDGESSGGLSSGAKIGIGVGVAAVGVILLAFFTWFCLVRRRRRAGAMTTASQRSGGASRVSGAGGGGTATSERPGRSARAMSEVTSGSRPTARRWATQDYFGPDAVAGPYTETETVASDDAAAAAAASTPGRTRGVPLQAHSPSDVVAPVEIDSRVKSGFGRSAVAPVPEGVATPPTTEGRFELYGSEMPSPSPPMPSPPLMTPRSVQSARSVSMMERSPIDRSPGPAPSPEPRR
ncbi:hypothetical protein CkaCkLH20_00367 [Colletotrichum karsti]|uniref:Uncharacterized protein n=1 Tax=Colletotrichum karsti TaxID=1095194 RepID=A0A9P6LQX1_9PEZI|nr:uncharacterized protein CkaCkLH20_00367 [Colletotrichum karsti]KAF9882331.1 hypothetical protein CkaCkLH20_00367 [Colletotrichum karsti]